MEFSPVKDGENKVIYRGFYEDTEETRELVIPEGYEEIAENAFRDFEFIRSVRLPRSLKKIGASAFSGCKNLKRVVHLFFFLRHSDRFHLLQ